MPSPACSVKEKDRLSALRVRLPVFKAASPFLWPVSFGLQSPPHWPRFGLHVPLKVALDGGRRAGVGEVKTQASDMRHRAGPSFASCRLHALGGGDSGQSYSYVGIHWIINVAGRAPSPDPRQSAERGGPCHPQPPCSRLPPSPCPPHCPRTRPRPFPRWPVHPLPREGTHSLHLSHTLSQTLF